MLIGLIITAIILFIVYHLIHNSPSTEDIFIETDRYFDSLLKQSEENQNRLRQYNRLREKKLREEQKKRIMKFIEERDEYRNIEFWRSYFNIHPIKKKEEDFLTIEDMRIE